ncbi:MAG: InlB B-repeat-containing protein, partial [Clostridia bacterium]|nr:InlB B-repeat-containing protein [Clostridia bacterium]
SAAINFTVPANTQITVTTVSGSWGFCQYSSYTGWVYLPDLTYVSTIANAKYVMTLDPNGGTMPAGYTTTYYFSADEKFVDVMGGFPVPTRSGYTFDGWRRLDWTQDMWDDKWGSQPYTFGHDVTLQAEWTSTHTHSYTSAVTKAATCTEAGVRTYRCSCGDSYTEAIAAIGHNYKTTTTEATCTAEGKIVTTCQNYGDSYSESIEALGHAYAATVIDATCGEGGTITYTCVRCLDSYVETIPATGDHTYRETGYIEPTCIKDGSRIWTCAVCGDTVVETIASTGDHYYEQTGETDPTCVTDGCRTFACVMCGRIEVEIIAATGAHGYEMTEEIYPTCGVDGWRTYVCSMCGDVVVEAIATDLEHNYTAETTDATCTENGSVVYTCQNCGDSYFDIIPAYGHTWGEWVETTAPTTTSAGVETKTCDTCGATETREIPKLSDGTPAIADVYNYTVTIDGVVGVKEIRFAIGRYTTGSEIKAAEQNVTLDAATVAKYTVDGVFTYDLPWVGTYTF